MSHRSRGLSRRIWTGSATSDVYVASYGAIDRVKISLHETGDWREQYIDRRGPDRVRIAWKRPAEHLPGWTIAYRIFFPNSQLRVGTPYQSEPEVWLRAPGRGWTAAVTISIGASAADPQAVEADAPGRLLSLAQWNLPNKEQVLITAHRTRIPYATVRRLRRSAVTDVRARRPEGWRNVRALYSVGRDASGIVAGMEVAVPDHHG